MFKDSKEVFVANHGDGVGGSLQDGSLDAI